ncbi:MAG: hypothetical protein LBG43_02185 [Treponema sp.]|nr:hypothetical protein [Treponema sp.]
MFSKLNNLTDLPLNSNYYDLFGITPEELERDFAEEIRKERRFYVRQQHGRSCHQTGDY